MSESASILEKEISRVFRPVDRLSINNQGEGLSFWVPADEIEVSSLTASENGLFLAFEDECDAYDEIEVDVPEDVADTEDKSGKITGKDPDSGETLEVGLDEDGNLTEQAVPDHIKIVVLPAKRYYQEGEIIDFSYIHVYLMKKGTERFTCEQYPTGEIPFDELIFPVTVADPESDYAGIGSGRTYVSVPSNSCYTIISLQGEESGVHQCLITDNEAEVRATGLSYPSNGGETSWQYCFVSTKPFNFRKTSYNSTSWAQSDDACSNMVSTNPVKSTYKNKDYFIYMITLGTYNRYDSWSSVICSLDTATSWEEILTYDEAIERTFGDGASGDDSISIPVQWMRSDGEILEDTFEIIIGEGTDPEPEPDPYAGTCDFTWKGKKYCFNKSLARSEVIYSNGTIWQTWIGGQSPPYTVEQALSMGLIIQIG